MDRRKFLADTVRTVPALALGGILCRAGYAQTLSPSRQPAYTLPDHLPKKLSIGMFIWNWIAMATPGEPYHDLEKAVAGLRERGFNAVRVEAGLNWCFHADGRPRGEMEFGPWLPRYHDNLTAFNMVGGGRHDVLKRVIRLMELAKKYGVYVILTSWEYQDSTSFVADPAIRAEVMGIPEEERFMVLARHHDRLLRIFRDLSLHENIAFLEVHNEPEYSLLPGGEIGSKCTDRMVGKRLHGEAIAFLNKAHPEILVSGDYATHKPECVPDNIQVCDNHTYTGFSGSLWRQTIFHENFDPANPRKLKLLDQLLKTPFVPYDEFMSVARTQGVRTFWWPIHWLYHNLDNQRYDEWVVEDYRREEKGLNDSAVKMFAGDAKMATDRHIPAVCDEGGYFYPPLGAKFEVTAPGRSMFDLQVDLAIKHGYWGMMPTTYCGPEMPLWQNVQWLQTINGRFQAGKVLNS